MLSINILVLILVLCKYLFCLLKVLTKKQYKAEPADIFSSGIVLTAMLAGGENGILIFSEDDDSRTYFESFCHILFSLYPINYKYFSSRWRDASIYFVLDVFQYLGQLYSTII